MMVDDLIKELKKYEGNSLEVRFIRLEPIQGETQKFRRIERLKLSDENPFTVMSEGDNLCVEIRLLPPQVPAKNDQNEGPKLPKW
jgi:hypothetical protein